MNRRDFFKRVSGIISYIFLGIGGIFLLLKGIFYAKKPFRKVVMKHFSIYPEGSIVVTENFFLFREKEGYSALSRKCTHLGCNLIYSGNELDCPCHGSKFTLDGKVVKGPAQDDLHWYKVYINIRGEVIVDLDKKVEYSHRLYKVE